MCQIMPASGSLTLLWSRLPVCIARPRLTEQQCCYRAPEKAAEKPQNGPSAPQALKRDLIFKGLAVLLKAAPFQPSVQPEFFRNL
jgi:hypothetical protein